MLTADKCENKTETELVKLTLENQDYFMCLMLAYETKLTRYIRRISGWRNEDIEDTLQEVFIKVYKNLNEFDESLKFSSWIYRITHNHVISEVRKRKIRPEQFLKEEQSWEIFLSNIDLIKEVDRKLSRDKVEEVLIKLDSKYREVLVLKFLEEKDYNEVSDILRKPVGTVGTLINRAKKQFKEKYEQRYN